MTPTYYQTEEEKKYVQEIQKVQRIKTLNLQKRKTAFRNAVMMSYLQENRTSTKEVEKRRPTPS